MRSMTLPKETTQDTEMRLWSEYRLALSRCQGIEVRYHNAWREYVLSDGADAREWNELAAVWKHARQQEQEAYLAWKRGTYPQHGFTVYEGDSSS